jgi:hypothetical protein
MSLNEIVGLLIDESISRYIRAISLFELQIAIFRPKSFERLIEAEVGLCAPTKILRTARIFAAPSRQVRLSPDNSAKDQDGVTL